MNGISIDNLREEHAGYLVLIDLLEEEQRLLAQGAVDELPSVTARKGMMVTKLDALAQVRAGWLPEDPEAREALLAGNPELADAWVGLQDAARRANELNQLNGKIIHLRLKNTRDALSVLQQAAPDGTTYGPDGQPMGPGSGRTLGSA